MLPRIIVSGVAGLLLGLFLWGVLFLGNSGPVAADFPGASSHLAALPKGAAPVTDTKLRVLAQALALVEDQYVEPKPLKDLIYGSIQGAVSTLDSHSSFMTPEEYRELQIETKGKFSGIGIEITLKDRILTVVSPIEGTPAYRQGLQAGDQIVKINGSPTKNMSLSEAVKMIRGESGTKVTLTINREGFTQPKDFVIVRETIPIRSVKARVIEGGIGYIKLNNFQDQTDRDLQNYLKQMGKHLTPFKGLILDLRNDPGGLLEQATRVADEFLKSGLIVYTEGRSPQQISRIYATGGHKIEVPDPMVVIINEGSASASEIVAGALKDQKRAFVIGTKSFGKGSVQTIIPLEDGSALRLTTALFYTPSGTTIQDKGIIPDEVVQEPEIPDSKTLTKVREETLKKRMRKEGLTDKPWSQPITAQELDQDPQLKRAVDILRNWPPRKMTQQAAQPK
jgi:carboxyl-terminal processing protease